MIRPKCEDEVPVHGSASAHSTFGPEYRKCKHKATYVLTSRHHGKSALCGIHARPFRGEGALARVYDWAARSAL
ncbi:hypothetical protein LCGC14_0897570 [marine sediment metagenome]|uniref:Uncharacterized protein n=1 Tax=marine sediment metagenome TaxID=412755 RepID=A0A0F9RGI2_9ZZZZ